MQAQHDPVQTRWIERAPRVRQDQLIEDDLGVPSLHRPAQVLQYPQAVLIRPAVEYVTEEVHPCTFDRLGMEEIVLHSPDPWVKASDIIDHGREVLENKFTRGLREARIKCDQIVTAGAADINQNRSFRGRVGSGEDVVLDGEPFDPGWFISTDTFHEGIEVIENGRRRLPKCKGFERRPV